MESEPLPAGAAPEAGVDLQCTGRQEHFRALLFAANLDPMLKRISNDQTNRPADLACRKSLQLVLPHQRVKLGR